MIQNAPLCFQNIPKPGDTGLEVHSLQLLINRDFLTVIATKLTEDGVYGPKTQKAVSAIQKANGLAGSGIMGPKTLKILGIEIKPSTISGRIAITQDLKGKKDRHLHPNLRLMWELKAMPQGELPECFRLGQVQQSYAFAMKIFAELGIQEHGGNNKGTEVGYVQGTTGEYTEGGNGDAWCEDYGQCGVAICEDIFQKESPVPASAHCMTVLKGAMKIEGLVTMTPEFGTQALAKHGSGDELSGPGHAMPVVEILSEKNMLTSEGNTSIKDMRDGDGSGIKTRNIWKNGDLYTKGFVRVYPNNKVPV